MIYYILCGFLFAIALFLWIRCRGIKSKLKSKTKELESIQQNTEKEYQFQQDFITSLSQELRTPLYGIMGLTNLLTDEHPNLKDNKNLKSLKFTSDHLLSLINNVLQINHIDQKEIEAHKTSFNLRELTDNLINSFSYATENSDNTLHFEFDSEIDPLLYGNPAILSQILINFISNALKFTKNGNIYFSVNLIKKKENINNISFKVKHDGNEVSKEDERSIYREFMNVRKAKKSYLGTGLNSTIVNRLAEALGGEIMKSNNAQAGSEYAFVVDFEGQKDSPNEITAKDAKNKILIVDDNKLNLLVADKMLSKENFNCSTVDNGFDAITMARDNRYDIILMDINMPKLNGIGTTKRIREFDVKTPIIALTAVDVTQLNRQMMQAGLNDYILKPYEKNLLLEMIKKHLGEPAKN
ncbi:response regulator [Aquimarina sp. MMG016]|uniref:response regulator n=1 Tax=Aquimarina sp. MMG016 TaxID=2822690 RepID=UPI001B3A698C|nr:response regulator [Aquimarina sp. MMG016]MBQ4819378.1 response regulator [Aquimarina sp. MMG016]